jgi:hypothetical protein
MLNTVTAERCIMIAQILVLLYPVALATQCLKGNEEALETDV